MTISKLKTAFIGDVHAFSGFSHYVNMRNDYVQYNVPMDDVFVLGDLTYAGLAAEFDVIRKINNNWAADIHCIMGNHDYTNAILSDAERVAMRALFTEKIGDTLHYVVTRGNITFIMLSTDHPTEASGVAVGKGFMDAETLVWFEAALSAAQSGIVVVCTHQPPYDTSQWATERSTNIYSNDTTLKTLLATYRVDLWMYGHCHQPYKTQPDGGITIDLSEPYDGKTPEYDRTYPRTAFPKNHINGSNQTTFVPCWGGNEFYGSTTVESRYIEFVNGESQITIKARDHSENIWQVLSKNLDYEVTLPCAIVL